MVTQREVTEYFEYNEETGQLLWRKSRFKGVYQKKGRLCFYSTIFANGVNRYLGGFKTEEQAANAFDVAAIKAYGEYHMTNYKRPFQAMIASQESTT